MTSALGFLASASSVPHATLDPSFFFTAGGSLFLSYLAIWKSDLHAFMSLSSSLMFIADLKFGLTLIYAITAEATCLEAPNSICDTGIAVLPALTILPRTPATLDISLASGSAYTKFDCVSGINLYRLP